MSSTILRIPLKSSKWKLEAPTNLHQKPPLVIKICHSVPIKQIWWYTKKKASGNPAFQHYMKLPFRIRQTILASLSSLNMTMSDDLMLSPLRSHSLGETEKTHSVVDWLALDSLPINDRAQKVAKVNECSFIPCHLEPSYITCDLADQFRRFQGSIHLGTLST